MNKVLSLGLSIFLTLAILVMGVDFPTVGQISAAPPKDEAFPWQALEQQLKPILKKTDSLKKFQVVRAKIK